MGEAQLSSDFLDFVTFVNSFFVGSGSKSGSGGHSDSGSTTLRVKLVFKVEKSWWVRLSCRLIFLIC